MKKQKDTTPPDDGSNYEEQFNAIFKWLYENHPDVCDEYMKILYA